MSCEATELGGASCVCDPACTGGGLAAGEDPCVCSALIALFGDKRDLCGYNPRPGAPSVSYCGLMSGDGGTCSTACDVSTGLLTEVKFSGHGLEEVPANVGQLGSGLVKLDLSSNALTALPDGILALAGLQTLDLSSNRVSQVGNIFGPVHSLPNLRSLDLSSNAIRDIPGARLKALPGHMRTKLRGGDNEGVPLELYFNGQNPPLSRIRGKYVKFLEDITALHLQDNALTKLPASMKRLTKLAYLDVSRNSLRGKLPNAFKCSNTLPLGSCDLSGNPGVKCRSIEPDSPCCSSCLGPAGGSGPCAATSRTCQLSGTGGGGGKAAGGRAGCVL